MRYKLSGLRSTTNLTGTIHIEVPSDIPQESFKSILASKLNAGHELFPSWLNLLRYLPLRFMKHFAKKVKAEGQKGNFGLSARISNLGKIPIEQFQSKQFQGETAFIVGPEFVETPLLVILSGTNGHIDIVATAPKMFATKDRLKDALDRISKSLVLNSNTPDSYSVTEKPDKRNSIDENLCSAPELR